MEAQKSYRTKTITSEEAATVLIDLKHAKRLAPFFKTARNIQSVAEETSLKANTLLRQVYHYVDLGILEVAKEEKRNGRAIKYYQTTADVFFVPYEVTSSETLEVALAQRDRYYLDILRKNVVKARLDDIGVYGTRIYVDERDNLQMHTAVTPEDNTLQLDDGYTAALSAWRDTLFLDYEDAKKLQNEMYALIRQYQHKQGAQQYILRLGLAPIVED